MTSSSDKMEGFQRRDFLKAGVTMGAAMFVTPTWGGLGEKDQSKSNINKNYAMVNKKRRTLGSGKHAIQVTAVGLGCMGMSWHRSFIPDRQPMIALIRKAYDMGVNFFGTAEAYGPWKNEELVGEAIQSFRKNVILCSKFGFNIQNGQLSGLNSSPTHIREVVEQSLKRLKTDYIDLLYQHRIDPNVPIEDVAGAVKDLIKEGKVLHFGLSEADPANIRKAHAVQPVTALQTEYSIISRDAERDILDTCEQLGIGFVAYSPIARALLSGYINPLTKFDPDNDNRDTLPRYTPEAITANWPFIEAIQDFGNSRGLTATQVSLAWLLAQKPWIVPIPGTTKQAHLQENLWAIDYEFTPDELKVFTDTIGKIRIVGARN
ncbi:MAG: aldo/keto reductase [Cyclobacteriaceae bacterium]|jgi:aryl-alcohol dehydrogenase-like predicted oxidoreductase|nr:aldo/keto reductase [Flammeovirgaceae bacterium]